MREIRLSSSEGGGFDFDRFSLPLSARCANIYVALYSVMFAQP
jgi:hypothetical protein